MTLHYLDARAASSNDDPVRLFAEYDSQEGILTVTDKLPYQPPKDLFKNKTPEQIEIMKQVQKNSIILTDIGSAFRKWDMCFIQHEHLDAAVKAYFMLDAQKAIELEPEIESTCNLKNVIEMRKMDMTGSVYELNSDDVNNGHIALLMICWGAVQMRANLGLISHAEKPTQEDIDCFNVPFSI